MAMCIVCKEYFPPGFTEAIEDTKHFKCKFCIQGKDEIMTISKLDGIAQWDIKKQIVFEYKKFLNEAVKNRKLREDLFRNIKED